jgi:hypothetical protein
MIIPRTAKGAHSLSNAFNELIGVFCAGKGGGASAYKK